MNKELQDINAIVIDLNNRLNVIDDKIKSIDDNISKLLNELKPIHTIDKSVYPKEEFDYTNR